MDRVATVKARIGWKALTADEYLPEGYAFLATPNIKKDEIDFTNVKFISEFRSTSAARSTSSDTVSRTSASMSAWRSSSRRTA
jgi:hypothetical protein